MRALLSPSVKPSLPALALCAFAYLYVFPYQSRLNNPNENVRFYMVASLVEEGRYAIDGMRERWGWVNDAAVHDGHVYSVKAPGTSLLGVPAYAAYYGACKLTGHAYDRTEALWACRVFASILPALLGLLLLHGFLRRHARVPLLRDAVFFSAALGSLLYGYGMLFVSHATSAVAAFAAFVWLYDARHAPEGARERSLARAFAGGLATACVTLFEYPGLVASLCLAAYGLLVYRRSRGLLAFAAGGVPPALAMMHFQHSAFGNAFTPGHLMVENAALRGAHHEGFYGAVGPSADALYGLVVDPGAGLFPLTPVLIFALPGFVRLWREREQRLDTGVALAACVLTLLAIASMNNWRGGWTIGPRYLALLVPLLAWPALVGLEWLAERAAFASCALALGATAVALLASGLPSAYYPHLPPEFTRPLPQLFFVLIAHGYAPPNAGALAGVYGGASMLPLLACALGALWLCLRSLDGHRARLAVAVPALVVAGLLAVPILRRPAREPGVRKAVSFVTTHWSPAGHDRAARLAAELKRQRAPYDRDLAELARLYEEEGRLVDARRARKGRL